MSKKDYAAMDQSERVEREQKLSQPEPGGFPAADSLLSHRSDSLVAEEEAELNAAAMSVRPFGPFMTPGPSTEVVVSQPPANSGVISRTVIANPAQLQANREEEAIVGRVLAGDTEAFAELIERYKVAVFNLCARMLGNPTEAEDAAQEVFVRAYTQLHSYQPGRKFSTWILSISSHYCIDMLRRRKPQVDLEAIAFWKQSDLPEPEEHALSGETRDEVRELLSTLPDKYRGVTVLRYWQDLSYDEIAGATGLSVATVKTRLFRARELLAKELERQRLSGNRDESEPIKKPKARNLLKRNKTVNGNAK